MLEYTSHDDGTLEFTRNDDGTWAEIKRKNYNYAYENLDIKILREILQNRRLRYTGGVHPSTFLIGFGNGLTAAHVGVCGCGGSAPPPLQWASVAAVPPT